MTTDTLRSLKLEGEELWAEAHDLPSGGDRAEPTIAELYAELEGFKGAKGRRPVGFAVA